jgi:hypothetical protein
MPLHGTCFMGAGVAWSFIAIFTQQSSIAGWAASIQAAAGSIA